MILGINFKNLINLGYITQTPGSHFTFINYFLILMFDLFIIWVIFLFIYLLKKEKGTPIYNIFKKLSWSAFYMSIFLMGLLYARIYTVPFVSMRLILELYIILFVALFIYYLVYFIFFLKKDTIKFYRELTIQKYIPKKKKKNRRKSK